MTLVLIVQDVKCVGALANHVVLLSHGEVALARHADDVTLSEIEEA